MSVTVCGGLGVALRRHVLQLQAHEILVITYLGGRLIFEGKIAGSRGRARNAVT